MNGGGNFNELARIRAAPGFHITGGPPVRARQASAGPLSRVSASKIFSCQISVRLGAVGSRLLPIIQLRRATTKIIRAASACPRWRVISYPTSERRKRRQTT
jgi:hypothetical protein